MAAIIPTRDPHMPIAAGTRLGVYEFTAASALVAWVRSIAPATPGWAAMSR